MKWLKRFFTPTPKAPEPPLEPAPIIADNLPVDEAFVVRFKSKGGVFVYINTHEELLESFQKILLEAPEPARVFSHNEQVEELFYAQFTSYFERNDLQASHFLTDCEYLIAQEGDIMFSSRQLGQKRLDELPPALIVLARTSQIVPTLTAAMGALNRQTKEERPNNIRTLKSFQSPEEKDSIFYENCYRTTYLLLLEDLNTNE